MKHFCTLFDKNYLTRGLIMYRSLRWHCSEDFRLHVLPMDDQTMEALTQFQMPPKSMRLYNHGFVSRKMKLEPCRKNRTWQEYAWTCASNLMSCILNLRPDVDTLTYLDADLMFFSDPKAIFDEMGDADIAITPHRFTPVNRPRLEKNGKFNVSWVTAKNAPIGRECISLWAKQCREWCYYRNEDGKFGDQKYLDEWPELYKGHVHEIENIGAGLAPWNLANYKLLGTERPVVARPGDMLGEFVVFYHYHEYIHGKRLSGYPLSPEAERLIYKPYIEQYEAIEKELVSIHA